MIYGEQTKFAESLSEEVLYAGDGSLDAASLEALSSRDGGDGIGGGKPKCLLFFLFFKKRKEMQMQRDVGVVFVDVHTYVSEPAIWRSAPAPALLCLCCAPSCLHRPHL